MKDPSALRNSELAAIHAAKKQLRLDDATYRLMLRNLTGHESSAALDARERRRVIEHLRARGFQRQAPVQAGVTRLRELAEPQLRMIRGLWAELRKAGALHDPSERALNRFCARVTHVDHVAWLAPEEATKVVEALKSWLRRVAERSAQCL